MEPTGMLKISKPFHWCAIPFICEGNTLLPPRPWGKSTDKYNFIIQSLCMVCLTYNTHICSFFSSFFFWGGGEEGYTFISHQKYAMHLYAMQSKNTCNPFFSLSNFYFGHCPWMRVTLVRETLCISCPWKRIKEEHKLVLMVSLLHSHWTWKMSELTLAASCRMAVMVLGPFSLATLLGFHCTHTKFNHGVKPIFQHILNKLNVTEQP